MSGRRVLVTGVKGTIARQLVEELLLDGRVDQIIGTDIGDEPYYFRDVDHSRFTYKAANVLKERELHNLFLSQDFRAAEIDTVAHLQFIDDPVIARQFGTSPVSMNVEGTRALLLRCEEAGCIRRFLYLSRHDVYLVRPGESAVIDERADLNFNPEAPLSVQDRVDTDMVCRTSIESDSLDVVVLRPSQIIGRNVGEPLNHFLHSPFCPVPIGFDPMVNPIHARDVVRALSLAIHGKQTGVFNIAGKDLAPLSAFIRLAGGTRLPVPRRVGRLLAATMRGVRLSRFDPRLSGDDLRHGAILATEKAQGDLGFAPKFHIKF